MFSYFKKESLLCLIFFSLFSFIYADSGCMDVNACNYDILADSDDGSCLYNDCEGVCGGNALDDDTDGVCNNNDVCPGFNDSIDADGDNTPDGCDLCPLDAENDADNDGICESDEIFGCTNNQSLTYNILATEDDGSCAPYIIDNIPSLNLSEDQELIEGINLLEYFEDSEGQQLSYTISKNLFDDNSSINASVSGGSNILVIDLDDNYFDSNGGEISIFATDTNGQNSPVMTFDVFITPVNDPPVITFVNGLDFTGSDLSYNHSISAENGSLLTLIIKADDSIDNVNGNDESSDISYFVNTTTVGNTGDYTLNETDDGDVRKLILEYNIDTNNDFVFDVNLSNGSDDDVVLTVDIIVEATTPPIIDSIDNKTIDEDGILTVDFNVASDTPSVYENIELSNMSQVGNYINTSLNGDVDNGYQLTITPIANWNGTFDVQVEIANGASNSDTETFSVTVNAMEDSPEFSYSPTTMWVDEDDSNPPNRYLYLYDVDTDSNLNINPYSYTNPGNYTISLDTNTEISSSDNSSNTVTNFNGKESLRFSYDFTNINQDWNGTRTFSATYAQNGLGSFSEDFNFEIRQVNDSPEIDENTVSDQTMDEDDTLDITVTASDIDAAVNLNEDELFSLNNLVFTCFGDQISCEPTNYTNDLNNYSRETTLTITPDDDYNKTTTVTIEVTDGQETVSDTFELTFIKENDAPEIDIPNQLGDENQNFELDLSSFSSDVDSNTNLNEPPVYSINLLTYSFNVLSNDDKVNASVTGSNLIVEPIDDFNGEVEIEVIATDESLDSDSETFIINFRKANDAPEFLNLPLPSQNMDEDDIVGLEVVVSATDIDSDTTFNLDGMAYNLDDLEFTCTGNQISCDATDVGGVATLTIIPDADYNKTTIITVEVSDGELSDTTTFELTINQVQDSPSLYIVSNGSLTNEITFNEDDDSGGVFFYIYDVDQDDDLNENPDEYNNGNYTLSFNPAISTVLNYTSGFSGESVYDVGSNGSLESVYSFIYSFSSIDNDWNGLENIIATYSDGISPSQDENFTVTVNQVNDAPDIVAPLDNQTIFEEQSDFEFTVSVTDIDSDENLNIIDTRYSLENLIFSCSGDQITCTPGVTDSNGEATLTIVPNENYNKTTTITVEVTDGDLTDSETFELTIDPRNDNPEISIEDQETDEEVDFVINSLIDYSTDIDSDLNLNQSPYDLSQLRFEVQLIGDNFDKASATINGSELTIEPDFDFFGDIDVEITVFDDDPTQLDDGQTGSYTDTFVLTVKNINDPPTIVDMACLNLVDCTINEDLGFDLDPNNLQELIVEITATDPDEDDLTYEATANRFTPSVVGNQITLVPEEHWFGTEDVTITVTDEFDSSTNSIITITVESVNDAPLLEQDPIEITINEGESVDIPLSVLDNDFYCEDGDANGCTAETFLFSIDDTPTTGILTLNGNVVTYEPDPLNLHFNGQTIFYYTADDQQGFNNISNVGEYRINVNPLNDAPYFDEVITDKTIDEDTSTNTIDLIGKDDDPTDELSFNASFDLPDMIDAFTITTITDTRAELVITPIDDFNGDIIVTVTVSDGNATAYDDDGNQEPSESSQTFNLTVNSVNDSPVLTEDSYVDESIDEETIFTRNLSATDIDSDVTLNTDTADDPYDLNGMTYSYQVLTNADKVESEEINGNLLSITPIDDFNGDIEIEITATDNDGVPGPSLPSITEIFILTVNALNDAPVFVGDLLDVAIDEDASTNIINLVATDADSDALTFTATFDPPEMIPEGNYTINETSDFEAELVITPIDDFNGPINVAIRVTDGNPDSYDNDGNYFPTSEDFDSFVLTVNSINDNPILTEASYTDEAIDEDNTFTRILSATDVDSTVTLNTDVLDSVYDITLMSYTVQINPNDVDKVDVVEIVNDNQLNITPIDDFSGDIEVEILATDNDGIPGPSLNSVSETFILTVNAFNDAPVFVGDLLDVAIDEDTSTNIINLVAIDADSDALTFTATFDPPEMVPEGNYTINETSDFEAELVITPVDDFNGPINVAIRVTDGNPDSYDNDGNYFDSSEDFDPFVLTVNSVNDSPTLTEASYVDEAIDEDTTFTRNLSSTDIDSNITLNTDVADDPYDLNDMTYSYTIVTNADKIESEEINGDLLSITPIDDFVGDIEIEIIATDNDDEPDPLGSLDSVSETFIISVLNRNDAPVIDIIADQLINEDNALTYIVSATDADNDDLTFTASLSSDLDNGNIDVWLGGWYYCEHTYSIVSIDDFSATLTVTPCENWNKDITVTVNVTDGHPDSYDNDGNYFESSEDQDDFLLEINPFNDAPITRSDCVCSDGVAVNALFDCDGDGVGDCLYNQDGYDKYFEDGVMLDANMNEINNNLIEIDFIDNNQDGRFVIVYDIDTLDDWNKNPDDINNLNFILDTHPSKEIDGVVTDLGTVTFNNSIMNWIPHPNYNGWLNIEYHVEDPGGLSSESSTFGIEIGSVNDDVEEFNLLSAIQDYPENDGVVAASLDSDYYIKFPNFVLEDDTVIELDDINSTNIIEYYEYIENNAPQQGNVTFKWERSYDVDTDIDLNDSPLGLLYRLELVDATNEKVYIIENNIYDLPGQDELTETWCDENDLVNCIVEVNINEGPYITYDLNESNVNLEDSNNNYSSFWENVINANEENLNFESIIIDGTVEYYWRVTAADYFSVGTWNLENRTPERPENIYTTDNSSDFYYIDFVQPSFSYNYILNNIYNNYFDLYTSASEDVLVNDSIYFSYHQQDVISHSSRMNNSLIGSDIFSVYDKFNEYGSISSYFAGEDLSGNISIDKNDIIFNTVLYRNVNTFNSPTNLMRMTVSNNSIENGKILIQETDSSNEELISNVISFNSSNINFDDSEVKIEFLEDQISSQFFNNISELHIVRIFENNIEILPTFNNNNSVYTYINQPGSFALIHSDLYEQQEVYETKIVSSYPNPFNPIVNLDYILENDSYVTIDVYNILGQKVVSLFSGDRLSGENSIMWNGKNSNGQMVSSGSYFISILNEDKHLIQKVTLMK